MTAGPHLRAIAQPEIPGMVDVARELAVGDRVRFAGEKQARLKVKARDERFVILTMPFNAQRTVIYTVIDLELGIRGASDSYGTGFETPTDIAESLAMFQSGGAAVSMRNSVRLNIADVKAADRG